MKNRHIMIAVALVAAALPVCAADQLVAGRSLVAKAPSSGSPRMRFVALSTTLVAPTPGGPDDPTLVGATLEIRAQSGESATFDLPAAGWTHNQAGTAYRFRSSDPSSAVRAGLLKDGSRLKVVARSTGITLDELSQRTIEGVFTTGTARYCALFGGNVVRDSPGQFVARRAPAPASCPACGNSILDGGEQCDPPGSSCGAGATCSADCTCPCDFLDSSECMYPFPSDWLTVRSSTTDTGRLVHFATATMPRNDANVPIDPVPYGLNDGFSNGVSILLHVPGVDLAMTGATPITDMAQSLDPETPVVLVNASTLAHHLNWVEIDSNASSDATRSLIIRPGVNLDEGTRYVVALRRLKDSSGTLITPSADFLAYRDNTPTGDPVKEGRRGHMEDIFATLAAAGVERSDLYLAWDFTVASRRNITERLLFMRDDAFARLGSNAPSFTVTLVENEVNSRIFRRVTGSYSVERYVDSTTPPARMVLGPDGLPLHQATPQPASFVCIIPRAALPTATDPATPARASIYGHGLLGSNSEVNAGNVQDMANEHNFVFCATNWIGMAGEDIPNAVAILQELGKFPSLTDRLQQGMVNQLYLARLMIHPQGFAADPAFQDSFGTPVIDPSDVFYDGNSQGGIFGGTVMAVAQDITRGVLGVPGMNYSLLLTRSTDFATYSAILYPRYPNELQRPLLLALIQMLWDRSDPNGYAHHMTDDPLPNTPPHKVLLHQAFGDHQVTNIATEVEARTIGASIHQPAIGAGRNPDVTPYLAIPAIPSYPFDGSALVVWDNATVTPPPLTNTAPTVPPDPHSFPRSSVAGRTQKSEFLKTGGAVIDVCSGAPCMAP